MFCKCCNINESLCKNGLCKKCNRKQQSRRYYLKNKTKIREKAKNKYKKDPEKAKKSNKKYIENNKDKIKESLKTYYEKNKESILKYQKEYRIKNKEKIKDRRRKYEKKRNKEDTHFKLRRIVSNAIYCAILRSSNNKGGSILDNLPYSIEELKVHLESQFESWMNWDNWGIYNSNTWDDNNSSTWTWQIDHIIPQSQLPYDSMKHENFKKCWNLSNLRPYSSKKNIKENRRI